MKIAQIPPLWESVPPKLYGGTERVVAHLCDSLTELGHEVSLFGTGDARTSARLVTVRDQSIRLDNAPLQSELAAHLTLLCEVRRLAQQFDILHFHIDLLHLTMFEEFANKSITTLHGRLDIKDLSTVYTRWPAFGLVSVSEDQRKPLPDANWLSTVAHGVPAHMFPFTKQPRGDYLAFLGRISPEKRPDVAIRLARRAGIPLRIAAKVDAVDRAYFETNIRPLLKESGVEFIGEIGDDRKAQFLGDALALLFPINWPEPFGLVMIEAMACGTPVIAWNCGSVPEVVDPGVTGFIVSCEDDAVAAIARVRGLDRRRVRATYERRFTSTIMANAYLDVYSQLLNDKERSHKPPLLTSELQRHSAAV